MTSCGLTHTTFVTPPSYNDYIEKSNKILVSNDFDYAMWIIFQTSASILVALFGLANFCFTNGINYIADNTKFSIILATSINIVSIIICIMTTIYSFDLLQTSICHLVETNKSCVFCNHDNKYSIVNLNLIILSFKPLILIFISLFMILPLIHWLLKIRRWFISCFMLFLAILTLEILSFIQQEQCGQFFSDCQKNCDSIQISAVYLCSIPTLSISFYLSISAVLCIIIARRNCNRNNDHRIEMINSSYLMERNRIHTI